MYNKRTKYFVLSALFFASLSIVFNLAVTDNPHFDIYDLAMNLLSEFAGMIFTVVIFNEYLSQREKMNLETKSKIFYQELECWIDNLEFTFATPARRFVPDFNEKQLWQQETFKHLCEKLKVDDYETVRHPNVPWYLFLEFQGADLENRCKSLLSSFQQIQDNKVTETLTHFLYKSDMIRSLADIKTIFESDAITGFERPKMLENYYNVPAEQDIEKIKDLKQWLECCKASQGKAVSRYNLFAKIAFVVFAFVFPVVGIKGLLNKDYLLAVFYLSTSAIYAAQLVYQFRKKKRVNKLGDLNNPKK